MEKITQGTKRYLDMQLEATGEHESFIHMSDVPLQKRGVGLWDKISQCTD